MIPTILRIHGSATEVTFDCEAVRVKGCGEFFAENGKIAGFVVSKASLRFDNGTRLTPDEQEELIRQYGKYASRPHVQNHWALRFE